MPHSSHTIVVFETRHHWEPELQRQFANEPMRVRGCRNWSELSDFAFAQPAAMLADSDFRRDNILKKPQADLIVIELPEDVTKCLQWLAVVASQPLLPNLILICSESAAELEWTLRDLGVRQILVGEITGERLAHCCRRCVQTDSVTAKTRRLVS